MCESASVGCVAGANPIGHEVFGKNGPKVGGGCAQNLAGFDMPELRFPQTSVHKHHLIKQSRIWVSTGADGADVRPKPNPGGPSSTMFWATPPSEFGPDVPIPTIAPQMHFPGAGPPDIPNAIPHLPCSRESGFAQDGGPRAAMLQGHFMWSAWAAQRCESAAQSAGSAPPGGVCPTMPPNKIRPLHQPLRAPNSKMRAAGPRPASMHHRPHNNLCRRLRATSLAWCSLSCLLSLALSLLLYFCLSLCRPTASGAMFLRSSHTSGSSASWSPPCRARPPSRASATPRRARPAARHVAGGRAPDGCQRRLVPSG